MPVYEFECPKGHVTEDVVPIGTKVWPCTACNAEWMAQHAAQFPADHRCACVHDANLAKRILSATPTTFRYNDRR